MRELSLLKGDVVKIYTKMSANGWWRGEVNGRVCLFSFSHFEWHCEKQNQKPATIEKKNKKTNIPTSWAFICMFKLTRRNMFSEVLLGSFSQQLNCFNVACSAACLDKIIWVENNQINSSWTFLNCVAHMDLGVGSEPQDLVEFVLLEIWFADWHRMLSTSLPDYNAIDWDMFFLRDFCFWSLKNCVWD